MNTVIYGLDLSLNHWAICQIDYETGTCIDYKFLTDSKKMVSFDSEHGFLLPPRDKKASETAECYNERRKSYSLDILLSLLYPKQRITTTSYISIEGYAYSAITKSLTQIAEVTGCIKNFLYEENYKIRIHDPLSVKLFATGKGNAFKKSIVEKAQECGLKFPQTLLKTVKKKKKVKGETFTFEEYDGPGTDISDAFFLGKILQIELKLRNGDIDLKDLSEEGRNIFLRTTKSYPVNILARPFILDNYEKM